MALQRHLEEATSHFLRSQFVDSLAKLEEAYTLPPRKSSVVVQCLLDNNRTVCMHQISQESSESAVSNSFEEVLLSLKGIPRSKSQGIVDCIVRYNQLITCLHGASDSQVRAQAASVAVSIQEYLAEDILQTLDDASSPPLVLLRCALLAAQILSGGTATEWPDLGGAHPHSKESWCTAMLLPTGCKVVTVSGVTNSTDESISLEGHLWIMKCLRACQNQSWREAIKVIKHKKKLWTRDIALEMLYVRAFCLYQLESFDEARSCLARLPMDSCQSLKVEGQQLLACCLAKQGKPHLAIMELNKTLNGVSQDSMLLPLLNLSTLFSKLDNRDTELALLDQLVEVSGNHPGPAGCPCLVFHPDAGHHLSTTEMQIKALYHTANRNLQLERYQEASERYLDLISLLEETEVITLSHSHHFPVDIPSISHIYLEGASALLQCRRYEEAEAICDAILRRSTSRKTSGLNDTTQSFGAAPIGDDKHSSGGSEFNNSTKSSLQDAMNTVDADDRLVESSRRDIDQSDSLTVTLASLHLVRSDCLFNLRNVERSLESLDDALFILHEYSCKEQPTRSSLPQSMAKRRKLDSGSIQVDSPIDSINLLKGRAYNNRALILIGQEKLGDALKALLASLEYCPGDFKIRRNHCLLLFKVGRKKEAYAEWRKLQNSSP